MKIDLITLNAVPNYGSVLQTFATQELFKQHGANVKVINYVREDCKYKNLSKSWFGNNMIKRIVMFPTLKRYKYIFGGFNKTYLNLTEKVYCTGEDFKNYPLTADAYCTGSDQVWNPKLNRGTVPPLFLSFVPKDNFKFAFSASFGQKQLSQEDVDETKKYIDEYRYISVRESSAVDIVEKQYHYPEATFVLDPTLSMPGDFWRQFKTDNAIKEDYLLVYNLNHSKEFDNYAVNFAKKNNLKLVRLCTRIDQFMLPGKSIIVPDVFDFVTLIDDAKYVLTDSFHASAFSMNLNTEPICVYPKKFSGRIESLLMLTNSLQRHIESFDDYDVVNRRVDFDMVNEILSRERNKTNSFIDMVFSEIKKAGTIK